MKELPYLTLEPYSRTFGIELEYNAFDGKNRPDGGAGAKPAGIDYVAMIVSLNTTDGVEIKDYQHTNNNLNSYEVKMDSSCGLEVCTPIYKAWHGLKKTCEVVYGISQEPKIKADNRCSIHVHVGIDDLGSEELGSVIAHWFKAESIFMDSVPSSRKRNRYCQFMGMMEMVEHDSKITPQDIIKRVGNVKYYSLNTHQLLKNNRKTLEFRIGEAEGCKDPYYVKNWVRLLVHFVEMTKKRPFPAPYDEKNPDDPWQSFLWLDVEDTLKLLGFNNNPHEYRLSPGLQEVRNWFLARLLKNMAKEDLGPRYYAYTDLRRVLDRFAAEGVVITPEILTPTDMKKALFDNETRV